MTHNSGALKIAMVAPPWYPLPPEGYGGIEFMCATLADGLVARGHRVTTIGAGPRGTAAKHIATYDPAPSERIGDRIPEVLHGAKVARILDDLDADIVHDNSLVGPISASGRTSPTIVTAHGPVTGEFGEYYEALANDIELVAISNAQRRAAPDLPWLKTVHNALDVDSVPFHDIQGKYAVWLGRLYGQEKGAVEAIEIARRAQLPLVMAGKCQEPTEKQYFDQEIRPRLGRDVEWIGEVGGAEKWKLLGEASCLLFPIQWDEPFGIVMIEAMATGTPVIGLNRGSVPEIVADGTTGFVCDNLDDMVIALDKLDTIDPASCRQHVRTNFDTPVMAEGYELAFYAALERRGLA